MSANYLPIAFVTSLLLTAGCNSSDNVAGAEVTTMTSDNSAIPVGGTTTVHASFSFDTGSVFSSNDDVVLVIRLPEGLHALEANSVLTTSSGSSTVTPQLLDCAGGLESYAVYDFTPGTLGVGAPSGDTQAQLDFEVEGIGVTDSSSVKGLANLKMVAFGCDVTFSSESSVDVKVQ